VTVRGDVERLIRSARPEKIYHLAGQAFVPKSFSQPLETFQANVTGALNVLEAVRQLTAAKELSPSVLIVSSAEVYGAVTEQDLPVSEQLPLRPANPYAASKACADLIAQQYASAFGLNVVIARPFNHLGPGQSDAFVGSAFAKQFAEMALGTRERRLHTGNLAPERDFTDVRDVVRAYALLMESPDRRGVYNICSGNPVSIQHIVDLLSGICGFSVEVVPDESRKRANEVPRISGTAAKLNSAAGWKPEIPLHKTLTDLMSYWKDRLRSPA
jgi:GDP-4-dehydro-6-deoxy-D-mannose reductase